MTVGDVTIPATPPELDAATAAIDRAGRESFPDSYAGLEVDQERVRAVVYRVPSDPFDDVVRQSAQATCVEVRDAEHALRELTGWHDRIVADLPSWPAEGVQIVTVGARHDGTGVEVGVRDVQRARDRLVARYGAAAPLIIVEQDPVVPIRAADPDH
jgi:hypothetical protein